MVRDWEAGALGGGMDGIGVGRGSRGREAASDGPKRLCEGQRLMLGVAEMDESLPLRPEAAVGQSETLFCIRRGQFV